MENKIKFLYSLSCVLVTAYICQLFTFKGYGLLYEASEKLFPIGQYYILPITWSILYALIVMSFYIILKVNDGAKKSYAIPLFLTLLILQCLFFYLFFVENLYILSFLFILILIAHSILVIKSFYKINKFSAYLLSLYPIWFLFALYLNFQFIFI